MKVLSLNGYFLLPDNFIGDISDALRVLADYHESPQAEKQRLTKEAANKTTDGDIWKGFIKGIPDGYKVYMGMAIGKHNGKEWEKINA